MSAELTAGYDLYLFDFDGVLFNTNKIKTQAFRKALSDYSPSAVKEFITYHQSNGGISRRIKIDFFFEKILSKTVTEGEKNRLLDIFNSVSSSLMSDAQPLPGVTRFLSALRNAGSKIAICSGGNVDQMQKILSDNNLQDHFDWIWGNEKAKAEHARTKVIREFERVVFFGDARYDMEVALDFGFDFVFVASLTDWSDGPRFTKEMGIPNIADFTDPFVWSLV